MRRLAAAVLLAGLAVPVWRAPGAAACSCVETTGRRAARDAVAVFVGTAEAATPMPGAPTAVVTRFAIEAAYKGGLAAGSEVAIVHEPRAPACGLTFDPGARYTVFAGEFHWRLIVSSCSGTAPGVISARALGLAPIPAAGSTASRGDHVALARGAAALVWLTAIALAGAFVWRSRRRPV